ncbi:MAG: hypothetical protein SCJ97_06980 [Bacillota bacterium]|nr:hypothetical protein [Bacillota bacterium]
MIKKILLVIICVSFLLVAAGCGNSEPAPAVNDTISIEVINETEEIIISFAVFFGSGLDEWGVDMLNDELIEPGESYTFVMPDGTYDLSLLTYELYVIEGVWDISDDIRVQVGGDGIIPVLVENNTDTDIALFYLSPSDSDDWGEDWLGDKYFIPAETGRRIFFVDPGIYDFLAIDLDGERVLEVYEVVIDAERTFTIN